MQLNKGLGNPRKKFQGFCKNCGIQGNKAVNYIKDKGIKITQVQKETRKLNNYNTIGHSAVSCTKKSIDMSFAGCILTNKPTKLFTRKSSKATILIQSKG
jgi:hypothetical protein